MNCNFKKFHAVYQLVDGAELPHHFKKFCILNQILTLYKTAHLVLKFVSVSFCCKKCPSMDEWS